MQASPTAIAAAAAASLVFVATGVRPADAAPLVGDVATVLPALIPGSKPGVRQPVPAPPAPKVPADPHDVPPGHLPPGLKADPHGKAGDIPFRPKPAEPTRPVDGPGGTRWDVPTSWTPEVPSIPTADPKSPAPPLAPGILQFRTAGGGRVLITWREAALVVSDEEAVRQGEGLRAASAVISRDVRFRRPPQVIRVGTRPAIELAYDTAEADGSTECCRVLLVPAGTGMAKLKLACPPVAFPDEDRRLERMVAKASLAPATVPTSSSETPDAVVVTQPGGTASGATPSAGGLPPVMLWGGGGAAVAAVLAWLVLARRG